MTVLMQPCDTCGRQECTLEFGMCSVCVRRFNPEPLTQDRLLEVLSRHIGAANGVSVAQLSLEMFGPIHASDAEHKTAERSIRDLVVELRLAGHHVCSHPSVGYYMAATPEELDASCKFLFDRAMTSLSQVAAMKRVSLPDLRGQLQLQT